MEDVPALRSAQQHAGEVHPAGLYQGQLPAYTHTHTQGPGREETHVK